MKKIRGIYLKNESELQVMREANQIVAKTLAAMAAAVAPGTPTLHFEEIARDYCKRYDVKPAFLGYHGFPFALCCSVNEEVVHGFPSQRRLQEGDIVSFDMGVVYRGFFGDAALTVPVGEIAPAAADLLAVTRASLAEGIGAMTVGGNLADVSRAVQKYVESRGYSVVKRFVGHGIGRSLHEKPEVPNFVAPGAKDIPLLPGMVLAIEPMVAAGGCDVEILADNWTAVTRDRSLSAHFEHSVALTQAGPVVLSELAA
ncbi:MAG: type I methionyl aminopeptidase [Desulfovibrionaceae bacterium]|nr:type I methionyl aminopeptidase [Desulfovibrionaceae bacterium]MBF0514369.1 type I methionyl aminopeptidase [Desulfovibrionaceae bacterium]